MVRLSTERDKTNKRSNKNLHWKELLNRCSKRANAGPSAVPAALKVTKAALTEVLYSIGAVSAM